jgi:hypothetical protein
MTTYGIAVIPTVGTCRLLIEILIATAPIEARDNVLVSLCNLPRVVWW